MSKRVILIDTETGESEMFSFQFFAHSIYNETTSVLLCQLQDRMARIEIQRLPKEGERRVR